MQDIPSLPSRAFEFVLALWPYWGIILASGIAPVTIMSFAAKFQDKVGPLSPLFRWIANPTARPWVILVIFICGFGYASFSAFDDVNKRLYKKQMEFSEAQRQKPNLVGSINYISVLGMTFNAAIPPNSILLVVTIQNAGNTQSIANRFWVVAKHGDEVYFGRLVNPPDPITGISEGRSVTWTSDDLIYTKASKPIAGGDGVQGFLLATFDSATPAVLTDATYTLSWQDVVQHHYAATIKISGIHQPPIGVFPGMKQKIQ